MTSGGQFDAVSVGTRIGPMRRSTGLAEWNRYAAINDEFMPMHMDDRAAQVAGMSAAFGQGNLQISYLHTLLRDWLNESGQISRLTARFLKPMFAGTVTVAASVAGVRSSAAKDEIDLDLTISDEDDIVLTVGSATVTVPASGSSRD